jgi:hypothetical protein
MANPQQEIPALLEAALVAPACASGPPLYKIEGDLFLFEQLEVAAKVKQRFYPCGPGEEFPSVWLARVGEIARRLRPAVPKTFH